MSKYDALWKWIGDNGADGVCLTFDRINEIAGVPVDHSFLTYTKELSEYGYRVEKISMKVQTVTFVKL